MKKTLLFTLIFIFVGTLLTFSFLRTMWQSWQSLRRVEEEQAAIESLEASVEALQKQVEEATSSYTLEKRARDELNLLKPGETTIRVVE